MTTEQLGFGLMSLGDNLTHPIDGTAVSDGQRHRSLVDQAVLAEQVGFEAVHLGEHHFCDYALSAPPVVLAAIGERTTSLALSTAVTLAGNLDPVRVAEDYATVDGLSDGRVELVLGRGNLFVDTYAGFGQPVDTARERYDEQVPLLVTLLREEDVHWSGDYRTPLTGHTTRPRPTGSMPIWIGAASKESVELAAQLGCRLMLPSVFGKPEMFAPLVGMYREAWERVGRDPADARIGACSHAFVGRDHEATRERWKSFYANYWSFVGDLLEGRGFWPDFDYADLLAGPAICGSPDQMAHRLGEWRELLSLDRHLLMFDLGGIAAPEALASIELFGSDVLPQFR